MATVHVAFCAALQGLPTANAQPDASEVITSSGTSQATTITAPGGGVVMITVTGGNVWAKIGSSPTASSANDWLLLSGSINPLGPVKAGHKVAIIDA